MFRGLRIVVDNIIKLWVLNLVFFFCLLFDKLIYNIMNFIMIGGYFIKV